MDGQQIVPDSAIRHNLCSRRSICETQGKRRGMGQHLEGSWLGGGGGGGGGGCTERESGAEFQLIFPSYFHLKLVSSNGSSLFLKMEIIPNIYLAVSKFQALF